MAPPEKIRKTAEATAKRTPPDGIIRFEVENVSKIISERDFEKRYSHEIIVKGVPWRMYVERQRHSMDYEEDDDLVVKLVTMCNQSTYAYVRARAVSILFNADPKKRKLRGTNEIGYLIMAWKKLVDPKEGFIKDDKIVLEFRFWVDSVKGLRVVPRTDFSDPDDPRHDIAFLIDGEKVYANKAVLAIHSPVFNAMFYGDFAEKDKKEIELNDVNREEFIEMLDVIYPSNKMIIPETAEYLLKLGDRFQIECVLDRAEKSLQYAEIPTLEKLRIADKYRLYNLLHSDYLRGLKTTGQVKAVEESALYKDLSDATKEALEKHKNYLQNKPPSPRSIFDF